MIVVRQKVDLAMARAQKSYADLRLAGFSSSTLWRIKSAPIYDTAPKVVGKLAELLSVDVTELIEQGE